MAASLDRHPRNSQGPFYVANGECISCGAPESEAQDLMSHDDGGHCYFVRQPESPEEVEQAIHATWASCCGAVRYGGKDAEIIRKLAILGSYDSCDEKLIPEPSGEIRSCVRFDFVPARPGASVRSRLKQLLHRLQSGLTSDYCKSSSFRLWWSKGSFRLNWGVPGLRCVIRIQARHDSSNRWVVRVSDNDAARVSFTLALEKVLRAQDSFRNIEWHAEENGVIFGEPAARPY